MDDDDHQSKRGKTADGATISYLKMLIPERETGNVIGKSGTVLKKICEESGARVRISAMDEIIPGTRERIATISGSLASILCAQHMITAALYDARAERANRDMASTEMGGSGMATDDTKSESRQLKLLFPHISCGVVMGRGGSFIKELMQTTGATVKVSQPEEIIASTQERIITITGSVAAIDAAQDLICNKMSEAPPAQQIKETDYSVLKFSNAVGAIGAIGGPGGHPAHHPAHHPAQLQGWSPFGRSAGGSMPYGQVPSAGAGGPMPYKLFINTLDDNVSPDQAQLKYQEYIRHVGACSNTRPATSSASAASTVRHELPLPDKIVSGIIGKGGTVIKEIQTRSGAKVQVSQKSNDKLNGDRVVTISGTTEQVSMAQHMISERCKAIEAQITQQANGGGQPLPYAQHAYPADNLNAHAAHFGGNSPAVNAQGHHDRTYDMGPASVYAPPPTLFGTPQW